MQKFKTFYILLLFPLILFIGCYNGENDTIREKELSDSLVNLEKEKMLNRIIKSNDAIELSKIDLKFSYQWTDSLINKKIFIDYFQLLDITKQDSLFTMIISPVISFPDYIIKIKCSNEELNEVLKLVNEDQIESNTGLIFTLNSVIKIPLRFEASILGSESAELSRLKEDCFIIEASFVKTITDKSIL
jgi:hypothetical protein